MRVLFTGATGVIGRVAIPLLIEAGHEVTGVARSTDGGAWLQSVGAVPISIDLFDPDAVGVAVDGSDAVVHFATSIPSGAKVTKRASWETNDRLRSEATANLVGAATAHDVGRFVQESVTFTYADGGDSWLHEDSPVDPPWDVLDSALEAERLVASFSASGGAGVVLRLSWLYGPGRASAERVEQVASRALPLIGRGDNYMSYIHVEDAATAVVAALDVPSGVYNVSEEDPVTARESLDALATLIGARPPRRVPERIAGMIAGPSAGLLSVSQRVSNRLFSQTARWKPLHPSVIEGWRTVVASSS